MMRTPRLHLEITELIYFTLQFFNSNQFAQQFPIDSQSQLDTVSYRTLIADQVLRGGNQWHVNGDIVSTGPDLLQWQGFDVDCSGVLRGICVR